MLENVFPNEIHRRLTAAYGSEVMSVQAVRKWCRLFKNGRTDVFDEEREGRPSSVSTDALREQIDAAIQENRNVRLSVLADQFDVAYGTAQRIVSEELGYRKICARWIPKTLSTDEKNMRFCCSMENLQRFLAEGNSFLDRIIAADETWVHHYTPLSKRASLTWKHKGSPRSTKTRRKQSAGKVMATLFFDKNGPILLEFMPKGTTINADRYLDTLMKLHQAVRNRRRGMLSRKPVLLHDNARPHVARVTQSMITTLNFTQIRHPPYSPDLSPCDFAIFGPLKMALQGRTFNSDEEVEKAVTEWVNNAGGEMWFRAIYDLVPRWNKCVDRLGEYVEH